MEMERLVELWKRAVGGGEEVYLATVVHVQGSSYRKPGARMLITSGGERAGTISGGCLEAEVSRKIAWYTQTGSSLQSYQSSFDDDNEGVPYGLGCGGTIWILMERGEVVHSVMQAVCLALEERRASVVVTSLATDELHRTVVFSEEQINNPGAQTMSPVAIERQMRLSLSRDRTVSVPQSDGVSIPQYICMPILPRPRLYVFGAGDDAQPIVRIGAELGWDITVADGRSHLLRAERFPKARHLEHLSYTTALPERPYRELANTPDMREDDCAAILTHSYEQDRAILKALLPQQLQYLGILGPLHRTRRLIDSLVEEIELSFDESLARLHAPVRLNIGSGDPAIIALSIVAEIQAQLAGTQAKAREQFAIRSGQRNSAAARDLNPKQNVW